MKKITLTIVAFLGLIAGAMAQSTATHQVDITINSVAMLRAVNNVAGTALNQFYYVQGSSIAGSQPSISGNGGGIYLQYTSIKTASGTPRTIKAVLSGTVPVGLSLGATAETPTGGTGAVGISNVFQTISAAAATMIKDIGSGYTGIAAGNGANVNYLLTISGMAALQATASTALTVTYTLSNE